jgi:hypothetical protein
MLFLLDYLTEVEAQLIISRLIKEEHDKYNRPVPI